MVEVHIVLACEQRVERVRSRVRSLFAQGYGRGSPVTLEVLGSLALELLVAERMLRKVLEENYPEEDKQRAYELLLKVEELKDVIVRMYMMVRVPQAPVRRGRRCRP